MRTRLLLAAALLSGSGLTACALIDDLSDPDAPAPEAEANDAPPPTDEEFLSETPTALPAGDDLDDLPSTGADDLTPVEDLGGDLGGGLGVLGVSPTIG